MVLARDLGFSRGHQSDDEDQDEVDEEEVKDDMDDDEEAEEDDKEESLGPSVPKNEMEGVLTRNGQSCLVAYHGNGARDMTSGVQLFFIFFVFVLLSSLASGSLHCPFRVMRDGPHVG